MAYGIDVAAHKSSLKHDIPTLGVLAHSIDRLYPSMHTQLSRQMQETGALLTECRGGTKPEEKIFQKKPIIAGLSMQLVVEARQKGGLITADIANHTIEMSLRFPVVRRPTQRLQPIDKEKYSLGPIGK